VYVYRRQDGSTFEIQQRISEDACVRGGEVHVLSVPCLRTPR
jgi:hypothetical protein